LLQVGPLLCGVDTTTPGTYWINYTAANSAGDVASARRQVVVAARCPAGEFRCDDFSCSTGALPPARLQSTPVTPRLAGLLCSLSSC
jgi:hypothetical protein